MFTPFWGCCNRIWSSDNRYTETLWSRTNLIVFGIRAFSLYSFLIEFPSGCVNNFDCFRRAFIVLNAIKFSTIKLLKWFYFKWIFEKDIERYTRCFTFSVILYFGTALYFVNERWSCDTFRNVTFWRRNVVWLIYSLSEPY